MSSSNRWSSFVGDWSCHGFGPLVKTKCVPGKTAWALAIFLSLGGLVFFIAQVDRDH